MDECGRTYGLELHHSIYGSGVRKSCEAIETVIFLCNFHHRDGRAGVHFNKELNRKLKVLASDRLKASGLSGEDLKQALGGRFYY